MLARVISYDEGGKSFPCQVHVLKTSNFNGKMSNVYTDPNGSPTTKKATSLSLACSRIRSRNEKIDSVFLLFLVPCTCYHVPGLLLSMSEACMLHQICFYKNV